FVFPQLHSEWNNTQSSFKFTVLETLDRIKEEFQFLQAQYHRCYILTHYPPSIDSITDRIYTPPSILTHAGLHRLYSHNPNLRATHVTQIFIQVSHKHQYMIEVKVCASHVPQGITVPTPLSKGLREPPGKHCSTSAAPLISLRNITQATLDISRNCTPESHRSLCLIDLDP
uniref:Groucho/TLE N-terminal Q-rich domain-containing protein n=1 Tax=Salmo trutta TaxID=8032 RepID=A0A674BVJ4_SALTR